MFKEENGFLYWRMGEDYQMYKVGEIQGNKRTKGKIYVFVHSSSRNYSEVFLKPREGFLLPLIFNDYEYNELKKNAISLLGFIKGATNVTKVYRGKDEIDAYEHYKMYQSVFDRDFYNVDMLFVHSTWDWTDENVKDLCYVVVTPKE